MRNANQPRHPVGRIALFVFIAIPTIPLLWTIVLSLKTNSQILTNPMGWPEEIQWINYANAIRKIPFAAMVRNTLLVLAGTLPFALLLSIFAAFALSRMRLGTGRMSNAVYLYFISGVIMPVFVLLFPVYVMMQKLHLHDTLWATILPHIAWVAPMNMLLMVGCFKAVPGEIEEAAVIDGCNVWRLLFQVFIPVVKPCLSTVFILNFLDVWNDFPLARVMLIDPGLRTISLAASYFKGQYSANYALMTAGVIILIVPQLAVFAFFQRYIIEGIAAGAVKG